MTESVTETVPGAAGNSPAPPPSGLPGPHLDAGAAIGRYVVLYRMGHGGMGVVYAAYDPELDRKVALKILRNDLSPTDRRELSRLEAKTMARLRHPNIVAVHDMGESAAGTFLAMEYVEGRDFLFWKSERPRSWQEILEVFLQAGSGLAAAHAAGLLHHDFKPSNVLVTSEGQARVSDFGLAQPLSVSDRGADKRSSPRGTPAYLAPERWSQNEEVDARSDQFSFCAAAYQALLGHLPFKSREDVYAGKIRVSASGHGVPPWVTQALTRGLSCDLGERFATMDELLEALSPSTRKRRIRRRIGMLGGLVAVVSILLVGRFWTSPQPCLGGELRMEAVWDDARRQEVRLAFAGIGSPFARETVAWIEEALNRYRRDWLHSHHDACEATFVRGVQSEALLDRRMLCLDDRLAELRAATESLTQTNEETLLEAGELVSGLRSIALCDDRAELAQRNLPNLDEPQLVELEHARAVTEAQHTAYRVGRRVDTMALEESAATGRRLRYPPLEARALQLLSYLAGQEGDVESANRFLFQALESAVAGGDKVLQVELYAALVESVQFNASLEAESRRWLALGEATLASLGPGHTGSEIVLQHAAGWLATQEGDSEQARSRLQRALGLAEQAWGSEDPRLAPLLTDLSNVASSRQEMIALARRSISIREQAFGRSNPKLGPPLVALSASLAEGGDYEPALVAVQRSLEVTRGFHGDDFWQLAFPLTLNGQILVAIDRPDEALERLEEARDLIDRSLGAPHPLMATVLLTLAEVRILQRQLEQARRLARDVEGMDLANGSAERVLLALVEGRLAVERGEETRAEKHLREVRAASAEILPVPQRLALETAMGESLLRQGRVREAVDCFEAALELGKGRDSHLVAEARFGLARATWQQSPQQARAMAERALDELKVGQSPRSRWLRSRVGAWVQHGGQHLPAD